MKVIHALLKVDDNNIYLDWITNNRISCFWYCCKRKEDYFMTIEFTDNQDATAFKLRFKI